MVSWIKYKWKWFNTIISDKITIEYASKFQCQFDKLSELFSDIISFLDLSLLDEIWNYTIKYVDVSAYSTLRKSIMNIIIPSICSKNNEKVGDVFKCIKNNWNSYFAKVDTPFLLDTIKKSQIEAKEIFYSNQLISSNILV